MNTSKNLMTQEKLTKEDVFTKIVNDSKYLSFTRNHITMLEEMFTVLNKPDTEFEKFCVVVYLNNFKSTDKISV